MNSNTRNAGGDTPDPKQTGSESDPGFTRPVDEAERQREAEFERLKGVIEDSEPGRVRSESSRWRCAICGSDEIYAYCAMWIGGEIQQEAEGDEPMYMFDADPWPIEGIRIEHDCWTCGETIPVEHAKSKDKVVGRRAR